jgi:hypothetical protein
MDGGAATLSRVAGGDEQIEAELGGIEPDNSPQRHSGTEKTEKWDNADRLR